MAARYRARQGSRKVTDVRNSKIIAEEPQFNLGGRSAEEIYRLTLLDSATLKRSITRRLSQLNHLVRYRRTTGPVEDHGILFAYFLRFVGFSLCDSCKEIRAAAFRALRHHTTTTHHCRQLEKAHVDFYLARALDLSLDNETERLQAICLVRKMIQLKSVSSAVINALIAIAADGGEERERMTRVCLETLCEILIYCPDHPSILSVLRVLMEFLLQSNCGPLTTAVVISVARYSVRSASRLPATFCDITHILHPVTSFEGMEETARHDARFNKTMMLQAAKNAIISTLRTWDGIHLLTATNGGLRSLVGVLFLSNQLAQEAVLDIVTALLFLPSEAEGQSRLACDSWSLQENFVADEGRALLPHVGRTRVNLCGNYLALLLFIFHQNGLIDALLHVISVEGKLHQRAFHLLNSFLTLAKVYLPTEFTGQMQSLPSLVALATNMNQSSARMQGADTLADLLRQSTSQDLLSCSSLRGASIYLEHVLELNCPGRYGLASREITVKDSETGIMLRDAVASMTNHEYAAWNWSLISASLKARLVHRDDPLGYKLLHRLAFFYKPSNKLFASIPKKDEHAACYTRCGCMFVEILVDESVDLMEDLLKDLHACLTAVKETPNTDVIFNPLKLFSSCAADYFILIGRISATPAGLKLLTSLRVLPLLMDFVSDRDIHESYVKLIVTCLDYNPGGGGEACRKLFEKVITSSSPAVRCYATLHLRTLLRAGMAGFCDWAMVLLISLMSDLNTVVARTAIEIVDEACDQQANLDVLLQSNSRPSLLHHLSPMSDFLGARITGMVEGFSDSGDLIGAELIKWRTGFNQSYVTYVEQTINSKLLASHFTDGVFYRQTSSQNDKFLPELFLPEHLYGQLVRHPDGADLIRLELGDLVWAIKETARHSELEIKAALWALGHIGRTAEGMAMLSEVDALDQVVNLVADHDNISVRGTAFFVLGLWSTTERGADLLKSRDWLAVRHDRHEAWPLVDQRVEYTWEDYSTTDLTSPQLLGLGKFTKRPSRILSYTSLPRGDLRSPSPRLMPPGDREMFGGAFHTGPAGTTVMQQQNKSSRGESGFESSDSGLLDGVVLGLTGRPARSESAKTDASDFSVGSLESDHANQDLPDAISPGPGDQQPYLKRRSLHFTLNRSKSGLYGSVDGVLTRTRRSETRHSFREITNSIKQVVLKRHSNQTPPVLSPLPTIQIQSPVGGSRTQGESSAREEKFIGICLPVRRSVWLHHDPVKATAWPLVQQDTACLHGQRVSASSDSPSGLEIHTQERCLVCFMADKDLSLVGRGHPTVLQRKEVLRFIWTLATPLGHKAAEQGILQLKNQLPECFVDACLYTEVCHLLASFTYKLSIRRLIQELFLDVPVQRSLLPFLEGELLQAETLLDVKIPEHDG